MGNASTLLELGGENADEGNFGRSFGNLRRRAMDSQALQMERNKRDMMSHPSKRFANKSSRNNNDHE